MTLLRAGRIDFKEIFSVEAILNSKGFEVTSEGKDVKLLLQSPDIKEADLKILFDAFDEQLSRSEVLNFILDPAVIPDNLASKKLINHPNFVSDRLCFSTSFEWYAGELMVRRFSAFSSSFGVEVKNVYRNSVEKAKTGDFDALVVTRDINLLYFECKTGKFNGKTILKCIERGIALHCELSIFFIKGKINEKVLKNQVKKMVHPIISNPYLQEIAIKGNTDSKVYEWSNCFFASASGNIEEQIRTIMRINTAKRAAFHYEFGLDDDMYSKIGYIRIPINL